MSPAEKFWLGTALFFVLLLTISCPIIGLIILLIYQFFVCIGYVANVEYKSDLKEYKKTIWYKTSLIRVINDFNNFLNKNFNKNGKI